MRKTLTTQIIEKKLRREKSKSLMAKRKRYHGNLLMNSALTAEQRIIQRQVLLKQANHTSLLIVELVQFDIS
jgi:hypothetical protein